MNSACISTDRVGVTSSTEHLRASDITSLKGYIGGALSWTHESLIQGSVATMDGSRPSSRHMFDLAAEEFEIENAVRKAARDAALEGVSE